MTTSETSLVLEVVRLFWPHSNLGDDPRRVLVVWSELLAPFERRTVEVAVRQLAESGREHAPPPGVVVAAVRQREALPAPSFDDMQLWLHRHVRCLPYHDHGDRAFVAALESLAAHGAHEAVLRFVLDKGVTTARRAPDPSWHGLDAGALADRRDLARFYENVTLAGWRRDPTAGRALERAREHYGAADPALVVTPHSRTVDREDRRELDGPPATPEQVQAAVLAARKALTMGRVARDRREAKARALLAERDAETRAAERELAEHAAARGKVSR